MRGSAGAQNWTNISATPALFSVSDGGLYALAAHATWGGGNIEVRPVLPDGSTKASFATPMKLTADGVIQANLEPGLYELTVTTATAIYAALSRVPND